MKYERTPLLKGCYFDLDHTATPRLTTRAAVTRIVSLVDRS
jgi:hypothetical protein